MISGMVTNALGLGQDIAEGGNLGPELIEFEGSRELVGPRAASSGSSSSCSASVSRPCKLCQAPGAL